MRFEVDPRRRLVLLYADERPSIDEWFSVLERACEHPDFGPRYDFLFDRRKIETTPTSAMMRAWMRRHAEFARGHGNGRLAVVVSEPVIFGMMRMASVFAEEDGVALGVFWSVEEALAWLGHAPH